MNSIKLLQATSSMDYKLRKGRSEAFYFSNRDMTYLIELFRILWGFIPVGKTNLDYFFSLLEAVGSLKINDPKWVFYFLWSSVHFQVEGNKQKLASLNTLFIISYPYQVPDVSTTRESDSLRLPVLWL